MKQSGRMNRFLVAVLLVGFGLLAASCSNQLPHEDKVIFTQLPVQSLNIDQLKIHDFRYASGMKIAVTDLDESLKNIEILTPDFHSARAPQVSFDGKVLIFSGQKGSGDVWQIWKLDMNENVLSQLTQSDQNCTDPLWLPDGRIAFSKQIEGEKSLTYHALFSSYPDGSNEQRITFQPHEDVSSNVLNDGRLIVSSKQIYPEKGVMKYLAIHPDGTKAELFYQTINDAITISKAWESMDRKLFFAESGNLVSIDFNRPLNSRKIIREAEQGFFISVFPMEGQQMLASIIKPAERSVGLAVIDLSNPAANLLYINNSEYHAVEPVLVRQRAVPKKLPSTVDMARESGYFVCMDVNRSDLIVEEPSSKIQVMGIDKVIGETTVEEDGSFYLEIRADQPIRFQALNEAGELVNEPSSWMWVRPNERRGCVGCHEDREMAPENFVPLAIEKLPVAMMN